MTLLTLRGALERLVKTIDAHGYGFTEAHWRCITQAAENARAALATPTPGEGAGDVEELKRIIVDTLSVVANEQKWRSALHALDALLARLAAVERERDEAVASQKHYCGICETGKLRGAANCAHCGAPIAETGNEPRFSYGEMRTHRDSALAERDAARAEAQEQRRVSACWEANATQWAADYDALWRRHEAAQADGARLREGLIFALAGLRHTWRS